MTIVLLLGVMGLAVGVVVTTALRRRLSLVWVNAGRGGSEGVHELKRETDPEGHSIGQTCIDQVWDQELTLEADVNEAQVAPMRTPVGRRFPTYTPLD